MGVAANVGKWIVNNIKGMYQLGRYGLPNWIAGKTGKAGRPINAVLGLGVGALATWWAVPNALGSVAMLSSVIGTAVSAFVFPPVAALLPIALSLVFLPFAVAIAAGAIGLLGAGKDAVFPNGIRGAIRNAKIRGQQRRYEREVRKQEKLRRKNELGNNFNPKSGKPGPANDNPQSGPNDNKKPPQRPAQGGDWF